MNKVTLAVPARMMTAIIGPSGSGKGTILNLIARFRDVWSGSVIIGGVDIGRWTLPRSIP